MNRKNPVDVSEIKFNKNLKNLSYLRHRKNIILKIGEFDQFGNTSGQLKTKYCTILLYINGDIFPETYKRVNSILKSDRVLASDFEWFTKPVSNSASFMNAGLKDYLEGEILNLTGLKIDVSNSYQEYLAFTNPNRYLEDYEKNDGFMKFPEKTKNMKLGQILSVFVKRFKPTCINQEFCEIAATNTFYALLASNALTACKSKPDRQKLDMLRVGLFISELYKRDTRNQCTSLYVGMSDVLNQSINNIKTNTADYYSYNNPTANFVMSLSKQETAAILVGLVGIGTSIALKWAQQICKNTDCSELSYSHSNNISVSNQIKSTSSTSFISNEKSKKTNITNSDLQIIEDGIHRYGSYTADRYKIICPNGHKNFIYYNAQKKCWMKTSSAFCDYSSTKGQEGLKKSAKILCGNN